MKTSFTLFLFSSIFLGTYAQEGLFSAPIKGKISNVLGKDNLGFFAAEHNDKGQSITISRYNLSSAKAEWTKTIAYGQGIADMQLEKTVYLNDHFYLYTSNFHQETEQLRISCIVLDNKGTAIGEPALVHSVLSEGRELSPQFGITISPDNKKFLIYFDPPFERKTTEPLSFRCYDLDLDMLWEKEILLPYTNQTRQVHQFALDNSANLYMMSGRKNDHDFNKPAKPETGKHILFYYNPKDHKLKEYDVTLKDKQIASVQMCFDAQQNIVVAGYYSLDYQMNISGTFFYTFGAQGGGVLAASFMPFRGPLIEKQKASGKEYLPHFILNQILPLSDGSTLLIGEQLYTTEHSLYNQIQNDNRVETHFHFGNILVSKLESTGRHIWNVAIPKEQYTLSDVSKCSYSLSNDAGSLSLYYNDHKENAEKFASSPAGEMSDWHEGISSITTCAKLSAEGNLVLQSMFSNKEKGGDLYPHMSDETYIKPMILMLGDGNQYRFSIVN